MIKVPLFDAFGTLFDTGNGSVNATKKIFSNFKIKKDPELIYQEWKKIHKDLTYNLNIFKTEEEIFKIGLKELYKKYNIVSNCYEDVKIMLNSLNNRKLFNDVKPCLNILGTKYKLCIASNSDNFPLDINMKNNNLVIDKTFTSENLKYYKPNKYFYKFILDNLGISNNETIFIGDSPIDDVIGPSQQGIKSIWLNRNKTNYNYVNAKPYKTITTLKELTKLINKSNLYY